MLPHRSDTSRGHLHPRRVATPRPFPSRRPFFPRSSLPPPPPSPGPSPASREGASLPCGRLCRHFRGGALARKPAFPSQASLLPATKPPSSPAIFNLPFPFLLSFPPFLLLVRLTRRLPMHNHCAHASNLDSLEIIPE